MNPHLTRLLALVNAARSARGERRVIKWVELTAALQLLSAPYSLEACALYCERFLSIVVARPMVVPAELGDIRSQLALLREVVRAGATDPYFSKSHLPVSSPTPLHPYTGDGPIVDVLMLEAYFQEDRREFRGLVEWFVWLGLHYHHRHLTAAAYTAYLDGAGAQSERLIREVDASVLVEASRTLRRLASPEEEAARNALTALNLELTEARGKYLASLARVVYGSPTVSKIQIRRWMQTTGLAEADARAELERMRYRVAGPLRHLLRSLWGVGEESRASGVRRRMSATIRHYSRPRVTRYRGFIEEITPLDQDDPDSPVSVTIYPVKPAPPRERRRDAWVDEGEDPDEPDGDAGSQIYAGHPDDNPITSYYKAKGYRYHTEYLNALLPWSRTRLGTTALRSLVAALRRCDGDTVAIRAVKLVVFLSLVTGRSLTDVCTVSVQRAMESGTAQDADLLLSLPERNLYVRAAEPILVRPRRTPLARVLHAHGQYLVLALPTFVVDLLGDGDSSVPEQWVARSLRDARTWLAAQPNQMGIRSEGVRNALVFALLEQNRGDLGLVKLITDRQGLNFQNIIHYAAYPVGRANTVWARAVNQLLGTHLQVPRTAKSGGDPDAYAGTPDAPNPQRLRVELDRLRARLGACLAGQDPDQSSGSGTAQLGSRPPAPSRLELAIRGHNLLTLYTLLWVNLATAGRARVAPAPVALLDDVALVADKHREDGSADRLVPLTPGVLAQLRAYFAYVWQLSLRRPQFRPIADAFATGVLQFQFLNQRGDVVDYRPK